MPDTALPPCHGALYGFLSALTTEAEALLERDQSDQPATASLPVRGVLVAGPRLGSSTRERCCDVQRFPRCRRRGRGVPSSGVRAAAYRDSTRKRSHVSHQACGGAGGGRGRLRASRVGGVAVELAVQSPDPGAPW